MRECFCCKQEQKRRGQGRGGGGEGQVNKYRYHCATVLEGTADVSATAHLLQVVEVSKALGDRHRLAEQLSHESLVAGGVGAGEGAC